MKTLLSLLLLAVAGCSSVPRPDPVDRAAYTRQVRESLEFASNSAQTRRFFTEFAEDGSRSPAQRMDRYFSVLGENVSSAVLALKDPYAQQISLTLNAELPAFAKAVNRRVLSGGSIVEMQDVMGMSREGNLIKVDLEAPDILVGYVYVMADPIEGRSPAEQTFVDYYRPGQTEVRKLSIASLIRLIQD